HLELRETVQLETHRAALLKIVELLMDPENGVIATKEESEIVGHSVVHARDKSSANVERDSLLKDEIRRFTSLAPLHNPPNLEGIEVGEEIFPRSRHLAVFDTGFHRTIPEVAKKYAIPDYLYSREGIQVYGFH